MNMRNVLAFDYGASSGRGVIGSFDGEQLTLSEVHRFSNEPVFLGEDFYWDFLRLFAEMKAGLQKAHAAGGYESVGIDTWGVDFGLLDHAGRLLGMVRHYRDARNTRAMEDLLQQIPVKTLFGSTGSQIQPFNTLFQLHAIREEEPWLLEQAQDLLLIPDLFGYLLTGVKHTDYTHASTTGLLRADTQNWDDDLIAQAGLPRRIFGAVSAPGEIIAPLSPTLCEELEIPTAKLVSVASHDTASAFAAVPIDMAAAPCDDRLHIAGNAAILSCGTWSLFGAELSRPLVNQEVQACNFTNEGGVGGTIRFLKNIMGTWLLQESRRHWARHGKDYSWDELARMAQESEYHVLVDVDDPSFSPPGNMPRRIAEACVRARSPAPASDADTIRCIYRSLAMKYRYTLDQLKQLTGQPVEIIHLVGGGAKDALLCSLTADICGVPVAAGPVEATATGNIIVQLIALGAVKDLAQARQIVGRSFAVKRYQPNDANALSEAEYTAYRAMIEKE